MGTRVPCRHGPAPCVKGRSRCPPSDSSRRLRLIKMPGLGFPAVDDGTNKSSPAGFIQSGSTSRENCWHGSLASLPFTGRGSPAPERADDWTSAMSPAKPVHPGPQTPQRGASTAAPVDKPGPCLWPSLSPGHRGDRTPVPRGSLKQPERRCLQKLTPNCAPTTTASLMVPVPPETLAAKMAL